MKKIYAFLTTLFVSAILILNIGFIDEVSAHGSFSNNWDVSCNYGSTGHLTSASCKTGGESRCSCPRSVHNIL